MSENKLPPEIEKELENLIKRHEFVNTTRPYKEAYGWIFEFIADKLAEEREKIASELANWFPVGANLTFTGGQLKSYIEKYLTPQEVGMKGGERNV